MNTWRSNCLILLALLTCQCGGESKTQDGGWQPESFHRDAPYVQEVGRVVGALDDVRVVAATPSGEIYAGTADGILILHDDGWDPLAPPAGAAVLDLAVAADGRLAVATVAGAAVDGQSVDLPPAAVPRTVAPRAAGGFWFAGDDFAGYFDGAYQSVFESIGQPVRALIDGPDGWWAATAAGVVGPATTYTSADGLPSDDVRALAMRADGTLWAGTDQGLAFLPPGASAFTPFLGADGLHFGDVLRMSIGSDEALLVATTMGASVYRPDGTRRYYLGRHWMAGDEVRSMVQAPNGDLWFATAAGVSVVEPVPMTLADRAALYDAIVQERHVRLGYTSTQCPLEVAGDLSTAYGIDDDNDGQWTAQYLASQCFRYAVTGDEEARSNARRAAMAMLVLHDVTGLDGFFARSIVPPEQCPAKQASGEGEWHLSDDGSWCWKGDTSSDEFVGHMFGLSLFYDLVADKAERAEVARVLSKTLGGMIDHDFQMLDADGAVTTHGNFDPEWMETDLSAMFGDAGLNSAMILGGLQVAYRATGEARFREAFVSLAHDHGYKDYVRQIEEINLAWHTNHDSEEMSFLAMYTLIRLEDDPALLALWLEGMDYLWQVNRPERNPEFNVMYAGSARAEASDLDHSIDTLQRLPLELIEWGQRASHRLDLDVDPAPDRFGLAQNKFVLPYDEREVMRWAENPYRLDQPGSGHTESSGLFWLLPYWMARYHGLIR